MIGDMVISQRFLRDIGEEGSPLVEYHRKRFDYLMGELEPYMNLGGQDGTEKK